jgi:glucose/arabinose dehydrogenase
MGIAVHGETVFVCATRGDDAADTNAWRVEVLRSSLGADGSLTPFEPLPIGPAQGAPRHQGCAVEVGPDEHVWVTIGDANLAAGANRAQDPASLNGKVVRLNPDGSVPSDAPFASGAYSIGHRNPQGIAFTADGRVLAVEHGTDVNDEINLVLPGRNYGYPCLTGADSVGPIPDACQPDGELTAPAWASGDSTLATSGAAVLPDEGWGGWAGSLLVTTLKEEDLRRFSIEANGSVRPLETLLDRRYGRLRAATIGPDGALYISTSNGSDDRILRVTLADPAEAATGSAGD